METLTNNSANAQGVEAMVDMVVLIKDNMPKGIMTERKYYSLNIRRWWDYEIRLTISANEWENMHISIVPSFLRKHGFSF